MKIGRGYVTIFAIFGAIVMLSLAFVQPVTAKESGQIDILRKYDDYMVTAKKLENRLSTDRTLIVLLEKLSYNKKLRDLTDDLNSAKDLDEMKILSEKFANALKSAKEYKQIESVVKTRYRKEIKMLEDFVKKLQNEPNDPEKLMNALLQKVGIRDRIGDDLYAMEAEPYRNSYSIKSTYQTQAKSSIKPLDGNMHKKLGASGSIKFDKHNDRPGHEAVSTHAAAKLDMNGNVYYWIPGYGWVNPACLGSLWLIIVIFLALFSIWSLFTHNWILFFICWTLAAWHYKRGHVLRGKWWEFWATFWFFRIQDVVLP